MLNPKPQSDAFILDPEPYQDDHELDAGSVTYLDPFTHKWVTLGGN